jgi:hypothetical protein
MQWLYPIGLAVVIYLALRVLSRSEPEPDASPPFGAVRQVAMIAGYAAFFASGLLVANYARVVSIPGLVIQELSFFDWLTLFSPMVIFVLFLVGILAAILVRRDLLLFLLGGLFVVLAVLSENDSLAVSLRVNIARLYTACTIAAPLAMLAWCFFGTSRSRHS